MAPASPAAAPPSAQAVTVSALAGSPTSRAARMLPPTTRVAKPCVLAESQSPAAMQASTPNTRPQCTSQSPMLPIRMLSSSASVEGLFRLPAATATPAAAAATPPSTSAPSLPMIMSPSRAGSAVHSAVRIKGAARVSVFWKENQLPNAPWYISA